ncbi:hypothetical protein [Labilibaculum euxinus]
MKQFLFLLFCFATLTCCDHEDDESFPSCEYSNPLEDLAWLKEYKETLTDCNTQISIFQANYKKHVVFYSALTDPRVNSVFEATTLWDCEGNTVRNFRGDEYEKFNKLVTSRVVLYRCKEDALDL